MYRLLPPLLLLSLSQAIAAQSTSPDEQALISKKQRLEQEAAQLHAEINADKARLAELQRLIDDWKQKNQQIDQQLDAEVQQIK